MPLVLWIAAGGAIGSAARHLVNVLAGRVMGFEFPWGTLVVNVVGCLAMGLFIGIATVKIPVSAEVRAFVTTGILGGFTTFSAFSLDFATLVERREVTSAALYGVGSVGLSLGAVFLGLWLVRQLAT
jgi:CrcB protein